MFPKLFEIRNSKRWYLVYFYLRNSRNNYFEKRKPIRDASLNVIISKFSVSANDLLLVAIYFMRFASVS